MRRVGTHPADASERALAVLARPELMLEGVWTHCAVADEPGNVFTAQQLSRFDATLAELRDAGARPDIVHAANSAGAMAHPGARRDLVRCGIAIYGVPPAPELASCLPLRPAMSLKAVVTYVKPVRAGDGISYGLHHRFERDSVVATVPVGYADGVSRRLSFTGGEVLIAGRRRPIVGAVTMDQLMVDCGPVGDAAADAVRPGDEVVLIGEQRGDRITADEWAQRLGTISYEVVCGIGPRIPRQYLGENG
jgi:alanine racemase